MPERVFVTIVEVALVVTGVAFLVFG
jgi:hypothetical protein